MSHSCLNADGQACTLQENRAKWNSLEAVSNFGWSGTSLFGGLLIDHYNYQISFHVTAFVQLLGILVGALPAVAVLPCEDA